MQRFEILSASSPWFFIGYWILQRGWVSTRPQFFNKKQFPHFHLFKSDD
jgi:hypothetical protein